MNAESDLAAPFEKASQRFVAWIIAFLPAALSLRFFADGYDW